MSLIRPERNTRVETYGPSRRQATEANDTVLRATGVLTLISIGAIHFLQIVPTTEARRPAVRPARSRASVAPAVSGSSSAA